jgi:hypothetical protein
MTDKQWDEPAEALARLREPFPAEQIGKLPKGGITLDFVGHGFITQRLLDVDPFWHWEPFALDGLGLPLLDESGGLWIRLTVCGVTRIGYGDAGGRKGPNAVKEAIGDALRNAGMRFGLALELWCKGADPDAPAAPAKPKSPADTAREQLLKLATANKLDPRKLGQRFANDYGLPVAEADVQTLQGFIQIVADEVAVDKAAADG